MHGIQIKQLTGETHLVLESEVCGGWHVQAWGQDDKLLREDTELTLLALAWVALQSSGYRKYMREAICVKH